MKTKWTINAKLALFNTLDYLTERNDSETYSNKIIVETEKALKEIQENPYQKNYYSEKINLYLKIFFKGKFALYYRIIEEETTIWIIDFRSTKQKPLF